MTTTLPSREALQARVEALERERGAALLDGRKFDNAALESARACLEALDNADAEAHRRQAEVASKAEAERQAKMRARIRQIHDALLKNVANAGDAMAALTRYLREAERIASEIRLAAASIGKPAPLALAHSEIETRLSRLIAHALTAGRGSGYGVMDWNSLPYGLDIAWAEYERAATSAAITELTTEEHKP